MAKSDPEALAQALRANLKKRKERMRSATGGEAPEPSFGTDEEGDVPVPDNGGKPGAWVREGSEKL